MAMKIFTFADFTHMHSAIASLEGALRRAGFILREEHSGVDLEWKYNINDESGRKGREARIATLTAKNTGAGGVFTFASTSAQREIVEGIVTDLITDHGGRPQHVEAAVRR